MRTPIFNGLIHGIGWIAPALILLGVAFGIVRLPIQFLAGPIWGLSFFDQFGADAAVVRLGVLLPILFSAMFLLLWGWVRLVERQSLRSIGMQPLWSDSRARRDLGRGVMIGVGLVVAFTLLIYLSGGYVMGRLAPALTQWDQMVMIGAFLLVFLIQGGTEEVIFRGWLLSRLSMKWGFGWAVLLSSGLFTFLHFPGFDAYFMILNLMLLSILLALMTWRSQSVWLAFGLHAGWNWLQAVGFAVPVTAIPFNIDAIVIEMLPDGPDWLTGGATGPEASAVTSLLLVAVCGLCYSRYVHKQIRERAA